MYLPRFHNLGMVARAPSGRPHHQVNQRRSQCVQHAQELQALVIESNPTLGKILDQRVKTLELADEISRL